MNEGRREIARQRQRLDDTFFRIASIDENDAEARADFAKYLCVRVSGYLETAVSRLLMAYAATQASPTVARYVSADLVRFQNARKYRLIELFGRFSESWRAELEAYLVDERADAIGTIVANRHKIAHGEDSNLTYVRVLGHWETVKKIVDDIADLVDPPA